MPSYPFPDAASPQRRLSRATAIVVAASTAYALLVVLFPWDAISRNGFSDFQDYVSYFTYFYTKNNISAVEIYQISTWREYFVHEILWYELVRWLTNKTGDPAIALRIVSFFILFVWSVFLLKRVKYGVALLFLFNPTAIDVAMSGIRNGLAWALFIAGLSMRSKYLRVALFLTGVFIHSTTAALILIYYLSESQSRIIRRKALLIGGLGLGILLGLALTLGSAAVLGSLGDRRVGANYVVGGGSLIQASIWIILLFQQCMSGREYVRRNIFVITLLAWYATMNYFIPWSFRVWAALLPVIAVSAMELPARKRQAFLALYSGYLVMQYAYWTKLFYYWRV